MATTTTNYSLNKPNIGGDTGAWGSQLNANMDTIDTTMKSISDVANAALPKAGGVVTGNIEHKTDTFGAVNLGSTLSGTVNLDLSLGNVFYGIMTNNVSITFSNVPASGKEVEIVLELERTNGTLTVTFPAAVKFSQNVNVTTEMGSTANMNVFFLYTRDAGTKWRASLIGNLVV